MYRTLIWTTCTNVRVRLWQISRAAAVIVCVCVCRGGDYCLDLL